MIGDIVLKGSIQFGDKWQTIQDGGIKGVCFSYSNVDFVFQDTSQDRADLDLICRHFGLGATVLSLAKSGGAAAASAGKSAASMGANIIQGLEHKQEAIAEAFARKITNPRQLEIVEAGGARAITEFIIKQGMLWGVFPAAILGTLTVLGAPVVVALLAKAVLWMPWIGKFWRILKEKVQAKYK